MKIFMIGLVVVIIVLGGFQVAPSEDLKLIQKELKKELEREELQDVLGYDSFVTFRTYSDGSHEITFSIKKTPPKKTLAKIACEAAERYYLRTGAPKISCSMVESRSLGRVMYVEYDNRGCHLRN